MRMIFDYILIGEQFINDGETFLKTGKKLAWSIHDRILFKEWSFQGDESVEVLFDEKIIDILDVDLELSDEKIIELSENINVLVNGKLIKKPDLFKAAFTYSPKFLNDTVRNLNTLADITTFHYFGYYFGYFGVFKPSIAEVIRCIPKHLIDKVTAFEIIKFPKTPVDLKTDQFYTDSGVHRCTTRLYTSA